MTVKQYKVFQSRKKQKCADCDEDQTFAVVWLVCIYWALALAFSRLWAIN